jgi:ATP-dependent Clp protease ATP-binding subunit ClpB
MFTPLNEKDVANIVKLQFAIVKKQLDESGIEIKISDAAVEWIAKAGYDPQYGARPVKRLMQKHILNELSKQLIAGTLNKSDSITVDSFGEGLVFIKK